MGSFRELLSRTFPTERQVIGACLFIAQQTVRAEKDQLTYAQQCIYLRDRFNASPYWLNMSDKTGYDYVNHAILDGDIAAGLDIIGNYMQNENNARLTSDNYFMNNSEGSVYEYLRRTISPDLRPTNINNWSQVDLDKMYGTEGMNPIPDYSHLKSL